MMEFNGRVAIVTGGANGIGGEVVSVLAEAGAVVVIADINEALGAEKAQMIKDQGSQALFIKTDVSDVRSVFQMIDQTIEHFGRLDFLINNAGISGGMGNSLEMTPEIWDRTLAINLKGMFFACQRAIPYMIDQKFGRIVNMASQAGQHGGFLSGCDYVSSKGGVLALTKKLAKEFGKYNITVNAIAPGSIATEMVRNSGKDFTSVEDATPLHRLGEPRELALAVKFLCGEGGAFMTGATLDMNGGVYMR